MTDQKSFTSRGFGFFDFVDTYGSECSIQESSNVLPRLWLGVDKHFNPNYTDSVRMHINREQAYLLSQLLLYFAITGELPEELPEVPKLYKEGEDDS